MKKDFELLSIEKILRKYPLPRRFVSYFLSQAAKADLSKCSNPDPRSMAAADMAERHGNGEDFTEEHMKAIVDEAHAAHSASSPVNPAHYAAYTAAHAARATRAAASSSSSHAAYFAATYVYFNFDSYVPVIVEDHKPLLLELIDKRLTKLERLLIFGKNCDDIS